MEIVISDFGDRAKKVTLVGKLDILGTGKAEPHLAAIAESRSDLVIEMLGVDFIASIGIHHLVMAAKSLARNSCKLVLLNPKPAVTEVLLMSGLQRILPIVRSEDEAREALNRVGAVSI
jgi:anti-sigma B factor antagonist